MRNGASRTIPRSPRRASSCIGSAMHDLGRGVPRSTFVRSTFSVGEERAADFGVRQGDAVHGQRRCNRTIVGLSSRGSRARKLSPSCSRCRRACVAPCEPGRLQSNRGRKWPSPHDVLSRTPEAGSTRFARFTSPAATDCVETRSHVSHGRDPMERTEHARTAPNTYRIRSEFGCWKLWETRSLCRHQAGREPRAARR